MLVIPGIKGMRAFMINTYNAVLKENSRRNSTVVTIKSESFCGICCSHSVVCHTGVHSISSG